jgi:hypothetical protein
MRFSAAAGTLAVVGGEGAETRSGASKTVSVTLGVTLRLMRVLTRGFTVK